MDQYEKKKALAWIDGYWLPRPVANEKTLEEDFEKAKQEYRDAVSRSMASVDLITFEEFRKFKGLCFPKAVR